MLMDQYGKDSKLRREAREQLYIRMSDAPLTTPLHFRRWLKHVDVISAPVLCVR
jgi:hypothetical protein